ncbi:hypothetical protein [Streptomyces sp. NPDC056549]|uniref:hypothetical protein n=1 Tax=Streptomyces sp. NPDC056549 TaxID=3345864 RepID=UPI0036BA2A05
MTTLVFTAPDAAEDVTQMRRALAAAAHEFQVTPAGREVRGWQGRTLGRRVGTSRLRLVSVASDRAGGRLWQGTALADTAVPWSVPRPRLRGVLDWTCGTPIAPNMPNSSTTPAVVGSSPVLDHDPGLPRIWWGDLHASSRALAVVPTDRVAVRQSWIDRSFRRFLGINPHRINSRTTGHADLHWAKLTTPDLDHL